MLDDEGAGGDDGLLALGDARRVLDDDDVVTLPGLELVELGVVLLLREVADGGEDAEAVEEAVIVVPLLEGAQLIALWESCCHLRGDEVGGEERSVSHGDVVVRIGRGKV